MKRQNSTMINGGSASNDSYSRNHGIYGKKYRYRALRVDLRHIILKKALTRYFEQKINKVNRVSSFFKNQCENTSTN